MNHKVLNKNSRKEVTNLFRSAFSDSEGESEGRLIGNLVSELCLNIDNQEIICFGTFENGSIIGSIFFTRLQFKDNIRVYMLAPVAVSTNRQGKGVGQKLIKYGLNNLKSRSVDVVTTYGDPSYYSRVGFRPLSESTIAAPLKLSMPEGWLGLSLTGEPIPAIDERPTCVREFNNPVYW
ncbi:GNAT family N-acetyltransferase [Rhodohalobacter barkolensis]|uniref:GNAT family N-acetyltransferase n=1 Tax=Rhodohalobacter barkolensis TaxID=2053187 RepID=A0A2N0VGU2_9BACT|nr:N-acetyltransferase [Rhodohalobacter barkolensis]PKD43368.1 GNAT family N-acetyltransferase [Rhodohalobacter barkolensis]